MLCLCMFQELLVAVFTGKPTFQMQSYITSTPLSFFQGNRTFLYGSAAAAILFIVVVALVWVMQLRQQAEMRAIVTTKNLVNSIEQTFESIIGAADFALMTSADEISHQISTGKVDPQSVTRYLVRQQDRLAFVDNIRGGDELGDVIYGSGTKSPPVNISDREYFIRLRDDRSAGLYIVKPLIGRHTKKWMLTLTRRIDKPDGSFGGVVFASIILDQVEAMLAKLNMPSG